MKTILTLTAALCLATPTWAQTKSADEEGPYQRYVTRAMKCMASAPGDATAQDACIVAAVEDCRSYAGVFEGCLTALSDGFDAGIQRVEAEELKVCDGDLDSACAVVLRGHALIRSGQGLDADGWSRALTGAD